MSGVTLTGNYNSIYLGSFGNEVTVAAGAYIFGLSASQGIGITDGIYAGPNVTQAQVANYGRIVGASGGYYAKSYGGLTGGIGVDIASIGGTVSNGGEIYGGQGSTSVDGPYDGGAGISLAGYGSVSNYGEVFGGAGGNSASGMGGFGGDGIDAGPGTYVYNSGLAQGGVGGSGYNPATYQMVGGNGGAGINLYEGGTLENYGTAFGGLAGGVVGGSDGVGVLLGNECTVGNRGTIQGAGGNTAPLSGVYGGDGIKGAGTATIGNDGTIIGGAGSLNELGLLTTTTGDAEGTNAGGSGGCGIDFTGTISIVNDGTIEGGAGGSDTLTGNYGGQGGEGIFVNGTATISNSGLIEAGIGGNSNSFLSNGGIGIMLDGVGTIFNSGTIAGGAGGAAPAGGYGGAGVYLSGGTLTNAGAIIGGAPGANTGGAANPYLQGEAVEFGALAATLIVDPGASFTGAVQANGKNDTLSLAGSGGTLTGLGSQFRAFTQVSVTAGASWTLTEANSLLNYEAMVVSGTLDVAGSFTDAGTVSVAKSGTLQAIGGGGITLTGAISGSGNLAAAAGDVVDLRGGGAFAGALTGSGTIRLDSAITLNAGAALTAKSLIDTGNVTLGAGTALTNRAGDTLSLTPASGATAQWAGAAGTKLTNAGTIVENGAGTATIAVAVVNTASITASAGKLSFLGPVTNSGIIDAASGTLSLANLSAATGKLEIGASGTLALLGADPAGQQVDFLATTGMLDLAKAGSFGGSITGFHGSDRIDLQGMAANKLSYAGGALTVKEGSATAATLHFTGSYTQGSFALASDGHGGSMITLV